MRFQRAQHFPYFLAEVSSRKLDREIRDRPADIARNQPEQAAWAALALSVTGDRNRALDYLEKALSAQEIEVILCLRYPSFDPIRSDPRYKAVVERLGLPE